MIWVKRIAAFLALLLLWAGLTLLLTPKARLCNAALERLAKEEVTLCYEKRETTPLSCGMRYTTLLFAHSPVAKIRTLNLSPLRIEADGILLQGMARSALPPRISQVRILPLSGEIHARGDFGTLEGRIDWRKRRLVLTLQPSATMRSDYRGTLRYFKRKNGKYLYETAF